jgi:hypothetical protein
VSPVKTLGWWLEGLIELSLQLYGETGFAIVFDYRSPYSDVSTRK